MRNLKGMRIPRSVPAPLIDLALWAGTSALMVMDLANTRAGILWGAPAALVTMAGLAFALRRRYPYTALAIMLTATTTNAFSSLVVPYGTFALSPLLVVGILAFLAGRDAPRVTPIATMSFAVIACTLAGYLAAVTFTGEDARQVLSGMVDWSGGALGLVLVVLTPWLFGWYATSHTRATQGGWEMAARMERTREAETDRARLRERARIASTMHDSLGHDLALLAVRASTLEMLSSDDSHRREAASEVRIAAHEATLRLREIIGVLRESDGGDPPEPLSVLVKRASDAGLRVRILREGIDPAPGSRAEHVTHRVVREALTNAAKYAPGGEVTVHVRHASDRTGIEVVDTGSEAVTAPVPARAGDDPGSGLSGLRALVGTVGGTFEAGPQESGFRVRVSVPTGTAQDPSDEEGTESTTERERTEARVRARRRLITAIAVPTVIGGVVLALAFSLLGWLSANSVLPQERYEEISVGDDRASVERALPRFAYPERSVEPVPVEPPGADCRFYLVDSGPGLPPVYRLCFADGVLVDKDVFHRDR